MSQNQEIINLNDDLTSNTSDDEIQSDSEVVLTISPSEPVASTSSDLSPVGAMVDDEEEDDDDEIDTEDEEIDTEEGEEGEEGEDEGEEEEENEDDYEEGGYEEMGEMLDDLLAKYMTDDKGRNIVSAINKNTVAIMKLTEMVGKMLPAIQTGPHGKRR